MVEKIIKFVKLLSQNKKFALKLIENADGYTDMYNHMKYLYDKIKLTNIKVDSGMANFDITKITRMEISTNGGMSILNTRDINFFPNLKTIILKNHDRLDLSMLNSIQSINLYNVKSVILPSVTIKYLKIRDSVNINLLGNSTISEFNIDSNITIHIDGNITITKITTTPLPKTFI